MKPAGEFVYLNGEILPAERAAISPFDVGLLRGYAVFDLLQTIGGKPYMLDEHLVRFRSSAEQLHLSVPASDDDIAAAIEELLALNAHAEATVRLVLTGGHSPDGMHFDPTRRPSSSSRTSCSTCRRTTTRRARNSSLASIAASSLRRRRRTTSPGCIRIRRSRKPEPWTCCTTPKDIVSEAATASFYIVKDGCVIAPREGVLWGTVGSRVLELAAEHREVIRRDIRIDEAFDADEAFLTSSVRGVVPITRLDERAIGDGRVGPVTRELMELYRLSAERAAGGSH